MKSHALPSLTLLYSILASSLALAAGAPFDTEGPLLSDEVAVMHYVSDCSPLPLLSGLRVCEEMPLDLNGDGYTDLIVGANQDQVQKRLYFGRGDGLFNSPIDFGVGQRTSGLVVADLDNDGDLDMVESARGDGTTGSNWLYINHDNVFNASNQFDDDDPLDNSHNRSSAVVVGDVNNDGKLDIIIANETPGAQENPGGATLPYGQTNYLYLNQTPAAPNNVNNPVFGAAIPLDPAGTEAYTRRIVLLDIEGDGDLDLAATSADNHLDDAGNGNVLYVNTGASPLFAPAVPLAGAADDADVANGVAAGDLDNDGDPDLVFSTWSRVNGEDAPDRYYINDPTHPDGRFGRTGTFGPSGPGFASRSSNVELGDFNKDGRLDAVVLNHEYPESPAAGDQNRLHLNTLTPTPFLDTDMGHPIVVPPGHGTQPLVGDLSRGLDAADLNEDGWLDLVILNRGQLGLRYLNCPASPGCDVLNRFENDDPSITAAGNPNPVPANSPIDLGSVENLSALSVADLDNSYPADFNAVPLYPTLNNNYSCTDPPSQFACGSSMITPAQGYTGPLNVLLKVYDGEDYSGNDVILTITVGGGGFTPQFTSTPVTAATQGAAYSYAITATDGDADALTITADTALPSWLTLSPTTSQAGTATATLSGTPQQAHIGPTPTITLRVCEVPCGLSAIQSFTIVVADGNDAPTFTSTAVTTATQGALYTYAITTADPDAGATRTVSAPTLPSWLLLTSVNPAAGTATLTGTPAAAQIGNHNVTLRVTDNIGAFAEQPFAITVASSNVAPVITTTSLPTGTVGVAYNATVAATDADLPPDTLAFSATGLPPGLAISAAGAISGTPTSATGSPFTVSVTVNDGRGGTATASLPLVVNTPAPGNQLPVITTTSLPAGTVGVAYNATVAATDADLPPDTLAFSATGLPPGLAISAAGAISGTPTSETGSPFTVSVTVNDGRGGTATASFQLVVNTPVPGNRPPTITSPAAQTATVGQAYSLNVATGASDPDNDPLTFSATGMPPGISLTAAGVVSGSPTTAGPFSVTVTVNDGRGGTASAGFQITVAAAPVTPPTPPPSGGGNGGGGSIGLGELLAMLLIGAMAGVRRRSSAAASVR